MELDIYGNQLTKYEILEIISEVKCVSDYEKLRDKFFKKKKRYRKPGELKIMTSPVVRVVCKVRSEWGVVTETVTYWSLKEWRRMKLQGYFYAAEDSIDLEKSF